LTASTHVPTPAIFAELERYLAELLDPTVYEHYDATSHFYSEFGCEFEASLVANTYHLPPDELVSASLNYHGHPFEFVAFAWQGGDAIQYGHVIHTLELAHADADFVAGCYAPGEPVTWLGDNTKHALENLIATNGTSHGTDEARAALCQRLSLSPVFNGALPPGLEQPSVPLPPPAAPSGWHFESCEDGIGVLAEGRYWGATLALPNRKDDVSSCIQVAKRHHARGEYASALFVLKHAYHHNVYQTREVAAWMADCYDALGRDFLVRRVQAYLQLHLRVKKVGQGFDVLRGDKHVGIWVDGELTEVAADETVDAFEVAQLVTRA
jgi:hypothetical protein